MDEEEGSDSDDEVTNRFDSDDVSNTYSCHDPRMERNA